MKLSQSQTLDSKTQTRSLAARSPTLANATAMAAPTAAAMSHEELDAAVANGDVAAIERALRAGLSPDTFMAHVTLLCRAASVT